MLAAALVATLAIPPLRRVLVSSWVFGLVARILPRMSETERIALEAGTVWWDRELFSGAPDFEALLAVGIPELTPDERAYLDGPVAELCRRLDDWEISRRGDMPPELWDFIKREKMMGMRIPREHGGLGFSATFLSTAITRIATRSVGAVVSVLIPNSVGPGELLLHYGTEAQKARLLPRLARGEEVPCFGLTEPEAGSDATSLTATGVVTRGLHDGQEVLGIRLDFEKRYITLGPVATLIGLAFVLKDPENALGKGPEPGLTVALIPASTPGVVTGARHDPLGVPFPVGPVSGKGVFVPVDAILGGPAQAGQGWRMLMEALAAGRGISLPALACGGSQTCARLAGAYATVRRQFGAPIGSFEGLEEPLARIGAYNYMMNATRRLTAAAVDAGERPAVLSAIAKAWLTEGMRRVVADAMDLQGGAGICRGPRSPLSRAWAAVPIGITVEGANILTRTMIVFGQGAIRCHRYVLDQIQAVAAKDLERFDRAFFGHLGALAANTVRCFAYGVSGGRLARAPVTGSEAVYYRHLARLSSAFALLADVSMGLLGGSLKRREKLTGRMADALAWMVIASAALKQYFDDDGPIADTPFLHWSATHALHQVEVALAGVVRQFPLPWARGLLGFLVFPLGPRLEAPDDELGARVAKGLLDDAPPRRLHTPDVFVPPPDEPGLGQLEAALADALAARPAEAALKKALKEGRVPRDPAATLLDRAVAAGILDPAAAALVARADASRRSAIAVDSFAPAP